MFFPFDLLHAAVLVIGVLLVAKHHKQGWEHPPVLSGIAFILIGLAAIF